MKRNKSYIAHKIDTEYRLKKKYERIRAKKQSENMARNNEDKKLEENKKE